MATAKHETSKQDTTTWWLMSHWSYLIHCLWLKFCYNLKINCWTMFRTVTCSSICCKRIIIVKRSMVQNHTWFEPNIESDPPKNYYFYLKGHLHWGKKRGFFLKKRAHILETLHKRWTQWYISKFQLKVHLRKQTVLSLEVTDWKNTFYPFFFFFSRLRLKCHSIKI